MSKTRIAVKNCRYDEPQKMLEDRRRELLHEVRGKMRNARTDGTKEHEVFDEGEVSEGDVQEEIEFALIQIKAETLNKIDAALRRLEEVPTATVSSAARKSPQHASGRCRSRCGARTVKKRVRPLRCATASCRDVLAHRRRFSTCPTDAEGRRATLEDGPDR